MGSPALRVSDVGGYNGHCPDPIILGIRGQRISLWGAQEAETEKPWLHTWMSYAAHIHTWCGITFTAAGNLTCTKPSLDAFGRLSVAARSSAICRFKKSSSNLTSRSCSSPMPGGSTNLGTHTAGFGGRWGFLALAFYKGVGGAVVNT